MIKLRSASYAILLPLVACTGVVGEASDQAGTSGNSAGSGSTGLVASAGSAGSTSSGGMLNSGGTLNSGGGSSGSASSSGGVAGSGVASGGTSPSGGSSNGGTCSIEALPAAVQSMLTNKCVTCHGATPLPGAPSLVSYANWVAASKSDPTKTNAAVALTRIQSSVSPMPPSPGSPASAAEIAALRDFVTQGYPKQSCPSGGGGAGGSGGGGGTAMGGAPGMDPLSATPRCTSMTSWTGGDRGSSSMNPGLACISCHSRGEGPSFSIAGTVYPTGHEPDRCNSTVGTAGARIVIIGADGKMVTLTPNSVGNFSSNTAIKTPYQAKVTYQGRERSMLSMQTSGDCNSCHTQNGSNSAPGRITVP